MLFLIVAPYSKAWDGEYQDTIRIFKNAGQSGRQDLDDTTDDWLSVGGQTYNMMVFFEDQRDFNDFTSGNFEFGAQANAVAITAGVSAAATTGGSSAGAGGGKNDATTVGEIKTCILPLT